MQTNRISASFCLLLWPLTVAAQPAPTASAVDHTFKDLVNRASSAHSYSWEGEMEIDVRHGQTAPFVAVSQSKIQLAVDLDGKSYLKLQKQGAEEYWLISDGKKSWAYLPSKKQYREEEVAAVSSEGGDDEAEAANEGSEEEQFARSAIPNLVDFTKRASSLALGKSMSLKFAGEKVNWPAIEMVIKPDAQGVSTIAEVVMDPEHPTLGRFVWVNMPKEGSTASSVRVNVLFHAFALAPPPPALFTFTPPGKAKLVEDLAIPGEPGAALLNRPSPDFEARTLAGDKIKLSDFRGKVVLLSFWASWCPPCRAELPTIAKLYAEEKDKGVVVFGVNDEDRSTARKYLEKAGLTLPTIDDGSKKANRLYRVSAIPTVYVIAADGKVVKWFRGGRSEESLRAALKSAGAAE